MSEDSINKAIKEHILHLRSIHFFLLVTCFAIFLVSVLGQKKTRIDLADEQFGNLMDVLGKWEGRENWLNEYIEERIREDKTKEKKDYFNLLTITGSPKDLEGDIYKVGDKIKIIRLWISHPVTTGEDYRTVPGYMSDKGSIRKPTNLGDFKRYFDEILSDIEVRYLDKIVDYENYSTGEIKSDDSVGSQNVKSVHSREFWLEKINHESPERQKTGEVRETRQRIPDCSLVGEGYCIAFRRDVSGALVRFRVRKTVEIPAFLNDEPLKIHIYEAFKKELEVDWKLRPFKELFPELDEIAENYMGLDVEVVKTILEERASSEKGEQFEIWGASIPGREISRWGIIIIFVVQLYFLLHLSPLPSLMEKTGELPIVPWTGLYSGWLSKTVFLSLGFLFPTGVMLMLLLNFARFQGKESNLVLIGAYTIFGLSLAVTSAAIVKIFHFQRIYAEKEAEISKNSNVNKIKINGGKNA